MIDYPVLTRAEQVTLPCLKSTPKQLAMPFDDSSHQLWLCNTESGYMVLKVCQQTVVEQSSFWLGMNQLFDMGFPASHDETEFTFQFIRERGRFIVPELVVARSHRFVMTRYMPGIDITDVTEDEWVVALSKHIAQLHQQVSLTWGRLNQPQFISKDWCNRLKTTLSSLLESTPKSISEGAYTTVLADIDRINETEFVPIMPDLRWDQFRLLESGELAVVDLDAFVMGPRALELVLLEYILTTEQWVLFKQNYTQRLEWPDYQQQKPCYQLLLFLMNVLGEHDLTRWMAR